MLPVPLVPDKTERYRSNERNLPARSFKTHFDSLELVLQRFL